MENAEINFNKILHQYYEDIKKSIPDYSNQPFIIPAYTKEEGFTPGLAQYAHKKSTQSPPQSIPLTTVQEKIFYIPIIHIIRDGKSYTLNYHTKDGPHDDEYASRVMPGQRIYDAVKQDLQNDFGYTKHFEIRGSTYVGAAPDKKGNLTKRYQVDILLRGVFDEHTPRPLGFKLSMQEDKMNATKRDIKNELQEIEKILNGVTDATIEKLKPFTTRQLKEHELFACFELFHMNDYAMGYNQTFLKEGALDTEYSSTDESIGESFLPQLRDYFEQQLVTMYGEFTLEEGGQYTKKLEELLVTWFSNCWKQAGGEDSIVPTYLMLEKEYDVIHDMSTGEILTEKEIVKRLAH